MKKKDTKTPQDIHLVPQFLVCSKQKYRQSKLFITKIYHLTIKRRLFIIFHYYFNKKSIICTKIRVLKSPKIPIWYPFPNNYNLFESNLLTIHFRQIIFNT